MLDIKFLGPPLENGALPAVLYFSLSAQDSLFMDPFNQPILPLQSSNVRIFSITLPYHLDYPPQTVLQIWADQLRQGSNFIEDFIEQVVIYLKTLFQSNIILPNQLALIGLSRGSYIATQVLARLDQVQCLLGFAPVTKLQILKEFKDLKTVVEPLELIHTLPHLLNRPIRYYIGNHDTRVSTATCFDFVETIAKATYRYHRSPPIELFITPSIGRDGHGTSPETFYQGALWLKKQLQI